MELICIFVECGLLTLQICLHQTITSPHVALSRLWQVPFVSKLEEQDVLLQYFVVCFPKGIVKDVHLICLILSKHNEADITDRWRDAVW